jgi:transcriptional regulator with XRE-family HTH domain
MANELIRLGIAVRQRREQLGLSQERLAEICEFDRTYISMIERGKRNPSFLNLLRLCKGLGTTINELAGDI